MKSSSSSRVFVALQPTPPVRAAVESLMDTGLQNARWTPPAQIHLTLRFIGETTADELTRIEEALTHVDVRTFFLPVEGAGGFPTRGHPHVLWAGVGRGHPFLHQLRQQVDDRLLTTGVSFELKPFVPHLTAARCREAPPVAVAHWLKRHRDFVGPTWPVDAFYLMSSELQPAGAIHRELRKYPLKS